MRNLNTVIFAQFAITQDNFGLRYDFLHKRIVYIGIVGVFNISTVIVWEVV